MSQTFHLNHSKSPPWKTSTTKVYKNALLKPQVIGVSIAPKKLNFETNH